MKIRCKISDLNFKMLAEKYVGMDINSENANLWELDKFNDELEVEVTIKEPIILQS